MESSLIATAVLWVFGPLLRRLLVQMGISCISSSFHSIIILYIVSLCFINSVSLSIFHFSISFASLCI